MTEQKITEIRNIYKDTDIIDMNAFIRRYENDTRAGVVKLVEAGLKKIDAHQNELERMEIMKSYEYDYANLDYICGIDEVGRGPLAGPVVTAAVILKKDSKLLYINDSKKVSAKMREVLYDQIMEEAIAVAIGIEDVKTIDEINILNATLSAMKKAVGGLSVTPQLLLVDAVTIPGVEMPQISIIKGDEKSISIAAASIIAKVTRDRMMCNYHELFPDYGFDSNKGYGSATHIEAIQSFGPCAIHRRSFIKNFV